MFRSYTIAVLMISMGSLSINTFAQEVQFSQYNAFPLYLNPGFTGKIEQQRLAFNSRSQWVNIDGAFNTTGFSYDYKWDNMNSGLGLLVIQDESSGGGFSTFTAGGLYSYHLQISDEVFLNSGVRVSFIQQKLNPNALTFTDQLIRNDGSATYEVFDNLAHDVVDYSWGSVLFYSNEEKARNFWLGLVLDHLTKPDISFKSLEGKSPMKFSMHGGAQISSSERKSGFPEHVISFSFLYKSQVKWDQGELGATYIKRIPHKKRTLTDWKKTQAKFEPSYKQNYGRSSDSKTPMPLVYVEGGLTYRGIPLIKRYKPGYSNHESFIVLLGFNYYDIKIAYTFDFTISIMGYSSSGGAHEISMIYKFAVPVSDKKTSKKKAKKQRALFDGA